MQILEQERKLMDKYNLGWIYSGGGCLHFSHNLKLTDETLWLINDLENHNGELEPSFSFPTDENQLCIFGLYYADVIGDDLKKRIYQTIQDNLSIIHEHKEIVWCFYDDHDFDGMVWEGFYFYDTLKNGVPKMFALTNEIDKLKESQ
tara:strand:+ start:279 stop:719 length:441 start_codon:yes stop_codon:yes gene_type:complete